MSAGETVTYPYADGNRLEARNTYFYTPYHGTALLSAWRRQRNDALRRLREVTGARAGVHAAAVSGTDRLLDSFESAIASGQEIGAETVAVVDRLVQRFEVSKRLHAEYDASWRPAPGSDFRTLERYVRFGIILDAMYERTRRVPYLNALLKLGDTLTSQLDALTAAQQPRVAKILGNEIRHVEALMEQPRSAAHAA